jgi:hypothetical protein
MSGRPGRPAAPLGLVDEPEVREARVASALVRVRDLGWEHESARYLALVERLAVGPGVTVSGSDPTVG